MAASVHRRAVGRNGLGSAATQLMRAVSRLLYPPGFRAGDTRIDKNTDPAIIYPVYDVEFTYSAEKDLKAFRKPEQKLILDGIEGNLRHEPTVETANRKKLRPNEISAWELRLGRYRVFYDVEVEVKIVAIQAIGFKDGSHLYIRGERTEL